MKHWIIPLLALLLTSGAAAQTVADQERDARVRNELTRLAVELNAAWNARDRSALERIYAPEFVWVHGFGYVDDRSTHIEEGLELRSRTGTRPPISFSFDPPAQLHVYGDVAVLRTLGRNSAGESYWGTNIYARRDGRWQIVQMQSTELNREPTPVDLNPEAFDAYVGRYERETGAHSEVLRAGDELIVRHPTLPARKLTPVGPDRFFDKAGNEHVFHRGADGRVTHFVIRVRGGGEVQGRRVQ